MVDYTSMRLLAERLIEANGRVVVLVKRDRAVDDSSKPWRGPPDPGTDVTVSVIGVILPPDMNQDPSGGLARRTTLRAFISSKSVDDATSGLDITEFDRLIDDVIEYKITNVREIAPGSVSILFDLDLEK